MANKWDDRKKAQEDEYFVRKERELLEKLKAKQASEGKVETQPASQLKCPRCGESLEVRHFQNIEIDQCSRCQGVWLDAGEIEQVVGKENDSWLGKFWRRSD